MYHYKAHGLLLTLISGLFFFSSQAPTLAAAMPQSSTPTEFPSPGLTCATTSTSTSTSAPLIADCEEALALIKPGGKPERCIAVFLTESNIRTVRTCTIQTYSQRGDAVCLAGDDIRGGVRFIIDSCRSTDSEFIQGSYTWTGEEEDADGVRLVKAP